ncbi:hypothetical protein ACWN8P_03170 [Vagococcus salmoninarum]|uniref:DUF5067 domain-containing protein n=1 Tax=Vagococcus salmoninarum TaxID=2739 RepID=A0A429ZTW0_9ENTE|nr:hypothetical protein [Vagococcus salmoninarum]RST97102.1 hypothetical protein CBF35_04025 [Vagococcus salmoninarum]
MKKGVLFLSLLLFLSGCGSLAISEPEVSDEPLTSEEELALLEEREAWKNRPHFQQTIGEFEENLLDYDIFHELNLIENSTIYQTRNKVIEIDYKSEGWPDSQHLESVLVYIDTRNRDLDDSRGEVSRIMEMLFGALGEDDYREEWVFEKMLEKDPVEGEAILEKSETANYSDKLSLETAHTSTEVTLFILPFEEVVEE